VPNLHGKIFSWLKHLTNSAGIRLSHKNSAAMWCMPEKFGVVAGGG